MSERVLAGTLSGIPIFSGSTDLCDSLKSSSTPCPLAAGPQTSQSTSTLPSTLPTGLFSGQFSWTDQKGQPILCIKIDINLQ